MNISDEMVNAARKHLPSSSMIRRAVAAALAARTLPETEEWEYGITWHPPRRGDLDDPEHFSGIATENEARVTGALVAGPGQVAKVWRRPRRPEMTTVPSGPWEPIPESEEQG